MTLAIRKELIVMGVRVWWARNVIMIPKSGDALKLPLRMKVCFKVLNVGTTPRLWVFACQF